MVEGNDSCNEQQSQKSFQETFYETTRQKEEDEDTVAQKAVHNFNITYGAFVKTMM